MLVAPGHVAPENDQDLAGGTLLGFRVETAKGADDASAPAGGGSIASCRSLSFCFASVRAVEGPLRCFEVQHV